jgi:hypothetical protein
MAVRATSRGTPDRSLNSPPQWGSTKPWSVTIYIALDVNECRNALGSIVSGTTRLLLVVALVVASWALLIATAVLLLGLTN